MILIAKYIIFDPSTRITKTPYVISPVLSGGSPAAQGPLKGWKGQKGKGEKKVKKK